MTRNDLSSGLVDFSKNLMVTIFAIFAFTAKTLLETQYAPARIMYVLSLFLALFSLHHAYRGALVRMNYFLAVTPSKKEQAADEKVAILPLGKLTETVRYVEYQYWASLIALGLLVSSICAHVACAGAGAGRAQAPIEILGAAEGELRAGEFAPLFTVSDSRHARTTALLRVGEASPVPFASGTRLTTEAEYELRVTRANASGIADSRVIHFAIDRTAPAIRISGFTPGVCVASDVTPTVTITDAHPASQAVVLDGAEFIPGTLVHAEGSHTLDVTATDAAANRASSSAKFIIDRTAPTISIADVADGGRYPGSAAARVSVADLNLTSSTITLDGAIYASGTPITSRGPHVLQVVATDCAGNTSTQAVHFTVH